MNIVTVQNSAGGGEQGHTDKVVLQCQPVL